MCFLSSTIFSEEFYEYELLFWWWEYWVSYKWWTWLMDMILICIIHEKWYFIQCSTWATPFPIQPPFNIAGWPVPNFGCHIATPRHLENSQQFWSRVRTGGPYISYYTGTTNVQWFWLYSCSKFNGGKYLELFKILTTNWHTC